MNAIETATETAALHSKRASRIARYLTPPRVFRLPLVQPDSVARQGDVTVQWHAQPQPEDMEPAGPVPKAGILLVNGAHGQHRALLSLGSWSPATGLLYAPAGWILAHTDEPHARHRPIRFAPGTWQVSRNQELDPQAMIPRAQND